jgi:glycosyltransferase involved in cell wall biosynthesis
MPRVAILFDNFGPYHLARLSVAARECELLAIETARRSGEYAWDVDPGSRGFQSECLFEGTSAKLDAAAVAARLETVFGRFKPDVVAVPGWASRAPLASAAWCLERRVPLVVMSESQAIDESRSAWREAVKRQIVGCFSAALVGGTPHADYMAQLGMPRERIFLGYDAVDNSYFAGKAETLKAEMLKSDGQRLPKRYFLASARFIGKKNLERLLRAYACYREKAETLKAEMLKGESTSPQPSPQSGEGVAPISDLRPLSSAPWSLVLLGDGPLRPAINSQLSALNLHACVHLPGFKQYPDLPAYYGLASAFVHASTTEQWGLVVNEAMASGLPVLVSNRCGCATDLVQDGVNGFTFDPYNIEQLAQLMFQVSAFQPFSLSAFGLASQRIIADWGPERFAQGLKAAVECALAVGPKRAAVLDRLLLRALAGR